MPKKVTITLDEDIIAFIDKQAAASGEVVNRSGYINQILNNHRRAVLEAEAIVALKADTNDPEYQAEIMAWDCVVGDGIEGYFYRTTKSTDNIRKRSKGDIISPFKS